MMNGIDCALARLPSAGDDATPIMFYPDSLAPRVVDWTDDGAPTAIRPLSVPAPVASNLSTFEALLPVVVAALAITFAVALGAFAAALYHVS
jgi:hypothetical protein